VTFHTHSPPLTIIFPWERESSSFSPPSEVGIFSLLRGTLFSLFFPMPEKKDNVFVFWKTSKPPANKEVFLCPEFLLFLYTQPQKKDNQQGRPPPLPVRIHTPLPLFFPPCLSLFIYWGQGKGYVSAPGTRTPPSLPHLVQVFSTTPLRPPSPSSNGEKYYHFLFPHDSLAGPTSPCDLEETLFPWGKEEKKGHFLFPSFRAPPETFFLFFPR